MRCTCASRAAPRLRDYRLRDYSQALRRARLAQRTTLHSYQVPTMVPEFCTKRLICMEYCPGVKISDTEELEKQGFDQALLTMLTMLTRLPTYYLVPWS